MLVNNHNQGSKNEIAEMLKFPRKEGGKKGKKGREGGEGGERKGKIEGEKGKGIEWGGLLGKEKKVCKK